MEGLSIRALVGPDHTMILQLDSRWVRVAGPDGQVYGERKLLHNHAGEQPFTRDLHGVTIPAGIKSVVIQARDQKYGYGGKTVEVSLSGR